MRLIQFLSDIMYWSRETLAEQVAGLMSPKRYELVHSFLHVVDNNSRNTTSRKLFKVKPLEEMIAGKTKQMEPKNICQKN